MSITTNSGQDNISFDNTKTPEIKQKSDFDSKISELKQQGLNDVLKVALASPQSIAPFWVGLANWIASGITYPFDKERAKLFVAEVKYSAYALIHIWAQAYFDKDHIIKDTKSRNLMSMNIGRREVLRDKQDYSAAEKLKKTCRSLDLTGFHAFKPSETDIPKSKKTDGICAGIRVDIAREYLIDGMSVEKIVEKNEKGASAEAAANQAVYELIDSNWDSGEQICNLFDKLRNISKSEGGDDLFHVDFDVVFQSFALIDSLMMYEITDVKEKSDEDKKSVDKSDHPFIAIMQEVAKDKEAGIFTKQFISTEDLDTFEKAAIKEINAKFEVNRKENGQTAQLQKDMHIQTLKWVRAGLEMKRAFIEMEVGKKRFPEQLLQHISNPLVNAALKAVKFSIIQQSRIGVIAKARGLKLSSVAGIMGVSAMHGNDAAYLKNLPKLQTGVYAIDFSNSRGLHAITYIKEDVKEYILDPNGVQLKCTDSQDSIFHIQKLLTFYDEPAIQSPLYQKNKPNHNIDITRIDLA